jgi:hypothetical protein
MALVARQFSTLREIVAFGGQIVHVDRHPIDDGAPRDPIPVNRPFLQIDRYRSVMRAEAQDLAVFQEHKSIIGIAKLAGTLDNRLEYRPDVGGGGRDHAENAAAPAWP